MVNRAIYASRPAAAAALAMLAAAPTSAQTVGAFLDSPLPDTSDRGRNIAVTERQRPEYEAQGIGLGGFLLYPKLETGIGYSDNVFNTPTNTRSDAYAEIDPELRLQSRWSNHDLRVTGGLDLRRFFKETIRNQSGYHARVDGRYDITRESNVVGFAQVRRDYQNQFYSSVPDSAIQPAQYVQVTAGARGTTRFGRVRGMLAADVNNFNFDDITLATGTVFNLDIRDRTVVRGAGRLEYALTPATAVFGEIDLSSINHRVDTIAPGIPNRDGSEARVLGGVSFDLSALVRAQIGAGYIRRGFAADNVYRTISNFTYDARVEYFPSGLTTISLAAVRSIEEAINATSSGYVANTFELRADHELLRNFILTAAAGYQMNDFVGIDRNDDFLSVRGEGTFMFAPELGVKAGVRYLDRNSSGNFSGQTFNELQGMVSLVLSR